MTTSSTIESVAGAAQFIGTQIAKYYGGPIGQAAASLLLGEVSWTASTTDLIVKIRSGEATGEDVADVLNRTAQVLAGFGVLAGCVNPIFLPITGAAAGALFVHENWGEIPDFDPALYPTPLALDLDGDGLETTGISGAHPTMFDHDGDGIRTGTGWLQGDDAFLALDRNGNGKIDNGSELFGVDTVLATGPNAGQKAANGFAALADLDSNHDGLFNALDSQFSTVRLWRDRNQDGLSQADELTTLNDAGISGINLASSATNIALPGGNVQSGASGNLDLAQNPFNSTFTDPIALTAAAQTLPGLHGSGRVRDLRQSSYAG